MEKKIIRTKRSQSDIIKFVEDLPIGMISEGKASDLVSEDSDDKGEGKVIPIDIHKKAKDDSYLVDVVLGLNEDKD